MYSYSGGEHIRAQYLANTIELKIALGGVIFCYEQHQEPATLREAEQIKELIRKLQKPFYKQFFKSLLVLKGEYLVNNGKIN